MNPQSYEPEPEPTTDESREAPLPERPVPGQSVPEQSVPEQPVPEQPVPEQSIPEQSVPEQPVSAGAAPDNRQCRYTLASGRHCRRWAVRAHDFCHEHARWMDTRVDGAIEVPLLEDPAAIALTLSQTARQLGWGRIPPPNARGIIAACRASQINLGHSLAIAKFQLAQAKFRLKLHQLKLTEHDLPPLPPTGSGSGADPTPSSGAHPLDDTLPPPQPLSACDPCIEAIMKGADESKLDCKHCPGYLAGNLRAPQLPDARNPPESPRPLAPPEPASDLSAMDLGPTNQPALDRDATNPNATNPDLREARSPERPVPERRAPERPVPNFLHLKEQWDNSLFETAKTVVNGRDYRWATNAERATPFDDVLHAPQTAPPPPIPAVPPPPMPDIS
jgi:hypothetical protein